MEKMNKKVYKLGYMFKIKNIEVVRYYTWNEILIEIGADFILAMSCTVKRDFKFDYWKAILWGSIIFQHIL